MLLGTRNLFQTPLKIKTDTKKAKILEFFEALGNENKKTQYYRKKLSSIMFS